MTYILTDTIEANSFMGLITDVRKNNFRQIPGNKLYAKVETAEVLRTLAITTAIIVIGLAGGSIGQQKSAYAQNATQNSTPASLAPTTIANV